MNIHNNERILSSETKCYIFDQYICNYLDWIKTWINLRNHNIKMKIKKFKH